jgi:hypothetical protein
MQQPSISRCVRRRGNLKTICCRNNCNNKNAVDNLTTNVLFSVLSRRGPKIQTKAITNHLLIASMQSYTHSPAHPPSSCNHFPIFSPRSSPPRARAPSPPFHLPHMTGVRLILTRTFAWCILHRAMLASARGHGAWGMRDMGHVVCGTGHRAWGVGHAQVKDLQRKREEYAEAQRKRAAVGRYVGM